MWTEAAKKFAAAAQTANLPPAALYDEAHPQRVDTDAQGWIIPASYQWTPGAEPLHRVITISETGLLLNVRHTTGYSILGPICATSPEALSTASTFEIQSLTTAINAHIEQPSTTSCT